jgi:hypothetical protein
MFYLVKNNQLKEWGDYKFNEACLELLDITMEEYNLRPNKYIVEDDVLVPNPNYEKEEEEKEKERVSHLKCTKRVLALMLQQMGISYTRLKELIATNEQAQLEWELCVELERCNPLLDIMGAQLGITSEQLDIMFKYANGEVDTLI